MKPSAISVFMIAGLLSVMLSGCRTGGEAPVNAPRPIISTEEEIIKGEVDTGLKENGAGDTEEQAFALPYQFARMYGIIQSEYPVYELDTVIESKLPQKEKAIYLTSAIHQKQELLVSMVLDDYSEVLTIPADGEPPADGVYDTLSDGTMIVSERYQAELWKSGEGLFLTGPGIPEAGIKPLESIYASDPAYFEAYRHKRYIIEARFEIPSALDHEDILSGYALRLLDFEIPLEFALKRVPEYGTLEELAEEEHGSMDTHDGISIISLGERVKEGTLISWYVFSEVGDRPISITYRPPNQEIDLPTLSGNGKQYSIRQLSANPYWDNMGHYRLSDIKRYGRRTQCLFDVPQKELNALLQVNIPGITFLNHEESSPVTLPVPKDDKEMNLDISWNDGSVRILRVTRMKEPQTSALEDEQGKVKVIERPAVYIDVMAVHEDKDLALRGLICQRKLRHGGWEHERYDFDGKGSLSGFRVYYDEGDTEVTLKFHGAAFYWNQPYVMQIECH